MNLKKMTIPTNRKLAGMIGIIVMVMTLTTTSCTKEAVRPQQQQPMPHSITQMAAKKAATILLTPPVGSYKRTLLINAAGDTVAQTAIQLAAVYTFTTSTTAFTVTSPKGSRPGTNTVTGQITTASPNILWLLYSEPPLGMIDTGVFTNTSTGFTLDSRSGTAGVLTIFTKQ